MNYTGEKQTGISKKVAVDADQIQPHLQYLFISVIRSLTLIYNVAVLRG